MSTITTRNGDSTLAKHDLYKVLIAPVVTEKSTRAFDDNNQYVFYVANSANRNDIKAAIELAFEQEKVEVESVKIMNVKGKTKRFGRTLGKRSDRKKAIIRLKSGEIDFAKYQA